MFCVVKKPNVPIIMLVLFFLTSCAKSRVDTAVSAGTPKWEAAREISYRYDKVRTRGEELTLAEKGIAYGEECIIEEPKNPACYYYHAINTGLYYKTKVIGYQNGLKVMMADCDKIIQLDASYDYGGAYRMLGIIYTEVPPTSLNRGAVVRDIDKAVDYLLIAIEIAPEYPENYIALAHAYLKRGENEAALNAVNTADSLLPSWRRHRDYMAWKRDIGRLTKKLERRINGLQS